MNSHRTKPSETVMSVCNGYFSYNSSSADNWSLLIKKFDVVRGELTVLRGENMSGKTTLLNLISGREKFTNADVCLTFNGQAVSATVLRRQTALLSNDDPMFPELSIWDNIRVGLPVTFDRKPLRWREQVVEFLEQSDIANFPSLDPPLSSLSTGGRALVKLCRAIIGQHPLVIIDEISSYLDDRRAAYFIEQALNLLAQKSAVIFVTHNPRDRALIHDLTQQRINRVRHLEIIRTDNRSELVNHAGE